MEYSTEMFNANSAAHKNKCELDGECKGYLVYVWKMTQQKKSCDSANLIEQKTDKKYIPETCQKLCNQTSTCTAVTIWTKKDETSATDNSGRCDLFTSCGTYADADSFVKSETKVYERSNATD